MVGEPHRSMVHAAPLLNSRKSYTTLTSYLSVWLGIWIWDFNWRKTSHSFAPPTNR